MYIKLKKVMKLSPVYALFVLRYQELFKLVTAGIMNLCARLDKKNK